jgi:hypothetical protein
VRQPGLCVRPREGPRHREGVRCGGGAPGGASRGSAKGEEGQEGGGGREGVRGKTLSKNKVPWIRVDVLQDIFIFFYAAVNKIPTNACWWTSSGRCPRIRKARRERTEAEKGFEMGPPSQPHLPFLIVLDCFGP